MKTLCFLLGMKALFKHLGELYVEKDYSCHSMVVPTISMSHHDSINIRVKFAF